MNVLILKKFNNYANRIVLRYETLLEYQQRASSFLTFSDINFNPNDGVITELIIGNETQQQPGATPGTTTLIDWDKNGAPDYLVCFEEPVVEEGSDDSSDEPTETIVSRWFITECVRTRSGQYHLTLKRDSIADHLTEVEDATCFIEKGIVEANDDPAIYNKESITTNQIKSDEFLLKDETQCPWIVGYVAKDRTETDNQGHMSLVPTTFAESSIPGPQASDSACSEIYTDETAFWNAHPELLGDLATLNSWKATVKLDVWYSKIYSYFRTGQSVTRNNNGELSYQEIGYNNLTGLYTRDDGINSNTWKSWITDSRNKLADELTKNWNSDSFKTAVLSQLEAKESIKFVSESQMQSFFNFVKRAPIIKIGTKYYIPYDAYGEGSSSTITDSHNLSVGSSAFQLFYDNLTLDLVDEDGSHDYVDGIPNGSTFNLEWSINRHSLGLREIFSECKAKVPATVPMLKDAPYHMFAIPYADNLALYSGNTLHCVTNKSVAMNAAQAMAQKAGVGVVYDVQLLPYCPVRDIIKTEKITAHASIEAPTTDIYYAKIGIGALERLYKIPVAKLNHQYVLSKDVTLDNTKRALGIRPHFITTQAGTSAKGVLKVLIGENLEQPTDYYDAYGIELRLTDIDDLTSTPIINIYKSVESMNSNTPDVTINYATYVAADYYIGIEATDNCDYEYFRGVTPPGGTPIYVITWQYMPGSTSGRLSGFPITISAWFNDYIYYEDYYLTKVDISNAITSDIVTVLDGAETDIVNTIFWCTDSQFSFNKYLDNYFLLQSDGSYKQDAVTKLINEKVKLPYDITEMKVRGQTDMVRLASPNYSNFFDINVIQNRGIEYINVDCTYKPYQPYMHLNPNFKGLYGADYNDVRGLICGGDYSIATTTDAWATYQLQNKNYQAIFDRQMQQLETQHSIQHDMNVMNAITGVGSATVGGAVSGAITGAKIGGGYGAIAGAVMGGVTSLVGSTLGGAADVSNADRLMELQRSTIKDVHYMQLDNIKALPLGLAKTSYLTNNNKLFPFLEFYTCTDTEDMAVRDYLNYNGMTINRFGKIRNFQADEQLPYIRAKLIRIDIHDDPHQVTAISNELATGVYLPEGDSDVIEEEGE